MSLERFLKGEPVNERMGRLMRGEDDDDAETAEQAAPRRESYADGTAITSHDREHLRRMLVGAGWQVLLKLLDTGLQHQEDAARRISVNRATPEGEIATAWKMIAANRDARNFIVSLAEGEKLRN